MKTQADFNRTGLIGVFSFLLMPASPTQTASWFRGKDGWFSEREEIIMVNRVLRDDPAKVSYLLFQLLTENTTDTI